MRQYYIILLLAYILKTLAGIPILYESYFTGNTTLLPYSSLIMILLSSVILLYVAISIAKTLSGSYYLHVLIFLAYFVIYGAILAIKLLNDYDLN
tara:strand:+ start:649 stop:933 length:285 start_codon:yes stop_codon:yes gene_type:complete